jgi:hypothetical protein
MLLPMLAAARSKNMGDRSPGYNHALNPTRPRGVEIVINATVRVNAIVRLNNMKTILQILLIAFICYSDPQKGFDLILKLTPQTIGTSFYNRSNHFVRSGEILFRCNINLSKIEIFGLLTRQLNIRKYV